MYSVLGDNQNVSAHITKWNVNAEGIRKGYRGRNRNQKDVTLYDEAVTESIEELHENGEDAISLDETTLELFKKEYDYVFVDFYARYAMKRIFVLILLATLRPLFTIYSSFAVGAVTVRISHPLGKRWPKSWWTRGNPAIQSPRV